MVRSAVGIDASRVVRALGDILRAENRGRCRTCRGARNRWRGNPRYSQHILWRHGFVTDRDTTGLQQGGKDCYGFSSFAMTPNRSSTANGFSSTFFAPRIFATCRKFTGPTIDLLPLIATTRQSGNS